MKRKYVVSLSLIIAAALLSCEGTIQDAQDFTPNKHPVIGIMTGARYDGNPVDSTNIINDTSYIITAEVSDPEGQPLTYEFTSDSGSFNNLVPTAYGCSILFVTGGVKGNTPVTIVMKATDTKNGVSEKTFTLGTGKPFPKLVVTPADISVNDSGVPTPITVWADCDGEFQIFCDNTISNESDAHIDIHQPATIFTAGDPARTVNICGKNLSSVPGGTKFFRLPDSSGPDKVWVVFWDLLGQESVRLVNVTITH